MKQIIQRIKEKYLNGFSQNQKILIGVVLVLFILVLLGLTLLGGREATPKVSSNLHPELSAPSNQEKEARNLEQTVGTEATDSSGPMSGLAAGPVKPIVPKINSDPAPSIPIPQTPYVAPGSVNPAPGPMDGTFARIKADYKKDSKYPLIIDYLAPLKEIADGRRAWNGWFRQSAVDFFGEKKAQAIEDEINRINGNKEARIRSSHYNSLDEVAAAVKKDTDNYIEKGAINEFLDHAREATDGKYPWNNTVKGLGETDLEKAWVDQVDTQVRPVKEARARKFQAVRYASLSQLIAAIKEDTKNFVQIAARDMFLDYINDQYKNHKLASPDVSSGGNLLEDYHLAELEKFVNK